MEVVVRSTLSRDRIRPEELREEAAAAFGLNIRALQSRRARPSVTVARKEIPVAVHFPRNGRQPVGPVGRSVHSARCAGAHVSEDVALR